MIVVNTNKDELEFLFYCEVCKLPIVDASLAEGLWASKEDLRAPVTMVHKGRCSTGHAKMNRSVDLDQIVHVLADRSVMDARATDRRMVSRALHLTKV